jgi:predicted MPP superfamily phosphohydrolase
MNKLLFIFIALFVMACTPQEPTKFKHDITSEQKPWAHEEFGESTLTFALFGDLTGGERLRVFDVAVAQLNLLHPDFIINVGDLIEGDYENIEDIHAQWDVFDQRAQNSEVPIFYVGGNHDLTGIDLTGVWQNRYGPTYYHFVYKNVLFLVLNSEDYSEERTQEIKKFRDEAISQVKEKGMEVFKETEYANLPELVSGGISAEQAIYFTKVIKANPEVEHTFLFVHKAPWKNEASEFMAIETALEHRSYTVFNGHAHTYEHEERLGHDYIRLATTGGAQFPQKGPSMDHVMLVTLEKDQVKIANLKLSGILDKYGNIPAGGDTLVFEKENLE